MPIVSAPTSSTVTTSDLSLEHTLSSGQVFRWNRAENGTWLAPVGSNSLVISCHQEGDFVTFDVINGSISYFERYFQLDIDLGLLYQTWTKFHTTDMGYSMSTLPGLRVCRQDTLECLFSFLCSSAAPVYRIKRMIDGFCKELGDTIPLPNGEVLYAFPRLEELASTPRSRYDELGLGYRGGYVRDAASELIARGGQAYLDSLPQMPYLDAKAALVSLPGVGAKIADCVCLFSLGKHNAVPIDTHMARIAKQVVAPDLVDKTLTPSLYDELADRFREKFGAHAGWAQQYLFTAELHKTGAWDSVAGQHKPGRKVRAA